MHERQINSPEASPSMSVQLWKSLLWLPLTRCLNSSQLSNHLGLGFMVRLSIGIEDVVEPLRRLVLDVRLRPRIPGKIGLGLSKHESPVDRCNSKLLRDRKNRVKPTSFRASHVLRAQDRAMVALQPFHMFLKILCIRVIVEREDIRV